MMSRNEAHGKFEVEERGVKLMLHGTIRNDDF